MVKARSVSILAAIAASLLLCGQYLAESALSDSLAFKPTWKTVAWLKGTGSLEQVRKEAGELKAENTRLENTISDRKNFVEKERNDIWDEIVDFKEKADAYEMAYIQKYEGEKMKLENTIKELQKLQGRNCSDQAKVGTNEVSVEQEPARTENEGYKAESKRLNSLLLERQRIDFEAPAKTEGTYLLAAEGVDLRKGRDASEMDYLKKYEGERRKLAKKNKVVRAEDVDFKASGDAYVVKKHEGEKRKLDTTIKELRESQDRLSAELEQARNEAEEFKTEHKAVLKKHEDQTRKLDTTIKELRESQDRLSSELEETRKEAEEFKAENMGLDSLRLEHKRVIIRIKATVQKTEKDTIAHVRGFQKEHHAREEESLKKHEGEKMKLDTTIKELRESQDRLSSELEETRKEAEEFKAENMGLDSLRLEHKRVIIRIKATVQKTEKDTIAHVRGFQKEHHAREEESLKKHEGEKMKLETTIKELQEAQERLSAELEQARKEAD